MQFNVDEAKALLEVHTLVLAKVEDKMSFSKNFLLLMLRWIGIATILLVCAWWVIPQAMEAFDPPYFNVEGKEMPEVNSPPAK